MLQTPPVDSPASLTDERVSVNQRLFYSVATGFEAARRVELFPKGHRSRRLHGHSFLAKIRTALPKKWAAFPGAEVAALHDMLQLAVAPLDYEFLNKRLDIPTDENLARWIRKQFKFRGVEYVGVQSTRDEGVDLDSNDHAHIWRRYAFESAHRLPNVPEGHKCGRMHGHGFEVILHADQNLNKKAIGVDYDLIDKLWEPIHQELNLACLNDIRGLENPTSELISSWIWHRVKPDLAELSWVTVYETASCGAHFDGQRYRIWKEMTLDSSVRLERAPKGDPRRRIHGHTYTLRLHLDAPLDEVMGWTIDFGDVKSLFDPVFKRLDHHPLYELPGVKDNDAASLAKWVQEQCASILPQVDRIDLYETRGCGVILAGGAEGPALPI